METIIVSILDFFRILAFVALAIAVLLMIPLALFRKTRKLSGKGFIGAAFVCGAYLWLWSSAICYSWNIWSLVIGWFLLGFGVYPIALLASAIQGAWPLFVELLISGLIVFCFRFFGVYIYSLTEDY